MTKAEREQRGLLKWDKDKVYFTGSDFSKPRTIYIDGGGRYWVEWYGDIIEVEEPNSYGYKTVEAY